MVKTRPVLTIVLAACLAYAPAVLADKSVKGVVLKGALRLKGTQTISFAARAAASIDIGNEIRRELEPDAHMEKLIRGSISPARVPAAHVPRPADSAIRAGAALGFDGLSHRDQRLADNGNQFSLEPPDQALAVGGGFVVEAVNTAIRFRLTNGAPLGPPISLNRFFNLPSAIVRSNPPVYGPFTSDPKAYYDADLKRFFVTMLAIDVDPATGNFLTTSSLMIAVSKTTSPLGEWLIYALDTTNDGLFGGPAHPGCPCFGDQPLIGADAHGFYITTNEFPIDGDGFNGAQVYAVSKQALAGALLAPVILISPGALEEGISYSLQPAATPPGGTHESANGGTEYFMSALDFNGSLDNRLSLWALTGTSTLLAPVPSLTLRQVTLASEVYGQPPAIQQRDGPLPLADLIRSGAFGKRTVEHLPLIESNDDRMNQTVFAAGKLWCALNTVVKTHNGPVQTGIAWFIVTPSWSGGALNGSVFNQGYVSVNRSSVAFPSVAVNTAGRGIIAFSLISSDYYPSAAYVNIDTSGTSNVFLAKAGTEPEDGLTGYSTFGGRVSRWGDYSAAVADEAGAIWFATEYIPGGPRTTLANWGTFIGKVIR